MNAAEHSIDRDSARDLVQEILDGVEDEYSGFPNDRSPLNNRMYFYSFSVQGWKNLDMDPCHISLNGVNKVFIFKNGSIIMHRTIENPSFEFFRKRGNKVKVTPLDNALIGEIEVSAQSEVIHPLYEKGTILGIEKWDCGNVIAEIEFNNIGKRKLSIKDALLSLPIADHPPSKEMDTKGMGTGFLYNLIPTLKRIYNKLLK